MEKISVAIRCRPETCAALPGDRQWRIEDNRITLHRPLGSPVSGVSFAFDHVFDCSSTNCMVYNLLIKSIIDAAVNGFNGTAFAYGQTSSGKTHTMNGSEEEPGITQLAVRDIFNNIKMIKDREFLIRVSYMEIYNEEINDLLSLGSERLPIHESLDRGIYVAGLREEIVNSAEQVLKLIKLGEANRRFGETNMNVRSSRSHTIFRMVIESSAKDSIASGDFQNADAIRVSVLNLVDLAGSERIAKTGSDGVRLKEGKYINKSLMILGNVINKLSDGAKQRGHIPYRDSKLTRILQPALGGNAKTSIICTVAPEEVHVEETKGTLQFASRAKRITNCAQVNEILTDAALLKRQKLEIEELRRKLQGSHSEVLEQVILKERNDMLKSELDREKLAMELQEEKRLRALLEKQVREQQIMMQNLSSIASSSDGSVQSSQGSDATGSCFNEALNGSDNSVKKIGFRTPNFKNMRSDFVVMRRTQLISPVSTPVPEISANVADEDAWFQLNNGHLTDLDLLQMTPSLKSNSFSSSDTSTEPIIKEEARDAEKFPFLRSECSKKMELLESTMKQLTILERKNVLLKEEKAKLEETLSASTENVKLLESEKEELLKDLNLERQNMADLSRQIKLFSLEYAQRERLLLSLHSKSRAMVESFRACPIPKPAQSEC